jgi:hypothetical protein
MALPYPTRDRAITDLTWLIPVGMALIFGAFFWFVRNRQGTPIMTKEDGGRR